MNFSLPIGLNRISWKPGEAFFRPYRVGTLPIGLNRISWKLEPVTNRHDVSIECALPIGLNRISWKPGNRYVALNESNPTDWVKSD